MLWCMTCGRDAPIDSKCEVPAQHRERRGMVSIVQGAASVMVCLVSWHGVVIDGPARPGGAHTIPIDTAAHP
jgi:hypothetical protein